MNEKELQQIIESCRKQDSDSQKRLYKHFYNYGMTICSRYARNREEAKEIFNDGFFKIFTKLQQYNPDHSFKAWLNRIMVNTAIDHYRKNQTKPQLVDIVHAQHYETRAIAIENISEREILDLVQQLAPSYRMVFTLHVVEGFKHPEIAEKLGITVGTSKSNLAKARTKLKAMLINLEKKTNRYG